ncbi:MAG: hypothetical protein E2O79_07165, partial [Caldithrix sp.]
MSKHNSNSQKVSSVPILLFGVVFLFFAGAIQAQDLIWARRAGGLSHDSGADIVVDASGNSYITGHFDESALFGVGEVNETTLHSAGSIDIFVAKYDANGLLLWAKQAGGSELGQGFGIAVDGSGNSYITGIFEGVATFGAGEANETTLTSAGSRDIFIARYNANAMLQWAKRAGGSNSNDHGLAIIVDASNNSYVTGFFNASATFGEGEANETTLTSAGSFDIFMVKYDADGLLLWAKEAGGLSFDFGAGISVDAFNNSYVTGVFEASPIFGRGEANETTLTSAGLGDIFVARYNAEGLLLWVKPAGGSEGERGSGIAVDASGNSYVTGEFEGSATFGASGVNETTLNSTGATDIFVAKYNAAGLLLWVKSAGGSAGDEGSGIVVDASGSSYVTGEFEGSATFGAGEANETTLNTARPTGLFLANYDPDGLLLWAKKAGEGFAGFGFGVRVGLDASNNKYISGLFEGFMTFGTGETNETMLSSAGDSDIFVAKYGSGSPTSVDETSILIDDFKLAQNYPNPFNPATIIFFESPKAVQISLAIYNLRGQLVRTLV